MEFFGLIGEKAGMTQMWDEEGNMIPVTIVKVNNNTVMAKRTQDKDGYEALVIAWKQNANYKRHNISKTVSATISDAKGSRWQGISEWRTERASDSIKALEIGTQLMVNSLEIGNKVDVEATSKGKGFAGVIKRWNFHMQDATHGNSLAHRAPGSIGQCQTPGRVWKGKKMAGHMGSEQVTVQNLKIHKIDEEQSLVFIKGAIPGPKGGVVKIKPSCKSGK